MPSKRISDIIPPKERREIPPPAKPQKKQQPVIPAKSTFSEKMAQAAKKSALVVQEVARVQSKTNKKAIFWPVLVVLLLVCLAGASYFLIKPKAEISIWPKKSPLAVESQVSVIKNASQGTNIIAGEMKTQECSSSQEFPATGTKLLNTKASGTIRVYNAYSTAPQTLIQNTRFVSDNGKLFRTPQKIVIPGARYEGSKLIPGELDVVVEAGEAGAEYNIGPSTFSLPALAGTSRYTAFYAKSSSSMTGGSRSETLQVTDEDIASAEESSSAVALDNCQKTLRASLSPEDYIVDDDAIKSEIVEIKPLARAGQEVDKFTLNIKVKSTAFVFQKSDLAEFAKTYIASKVPQGKELDENSITISYKPQDVDLSRGKIVLNVDISAKIYPTVDENAIKSAISSKLPEEVTASLKQFPEVDKFQLRLWPFWINKTPFELDGILVKLILD